MNPTEDDKFHTSEKTRDDLFSDRIYVPPPTPKQFEHIRVPLPFKKKNVQDPPLDTFETYWKKEKNTNYVGKEGMSPNDFATQFMNWLEYAFQVNPHCQPGVFAQVQKGITQLSEMYVSIVTSEEIPDPNDVAIISKSMFSLAALPFFYFMTINWYFLMVYSVDRNIMVRPLQEMSFMDLEEENPNWVKRIFAFWKPYITNVKQPVGEVDTEIFNFSTLTFNILNYVFGLFFKPIAILDYLLLDWLAPNVRIFEAKMVSFFLIFLFFVLFIEEFCGQNNQANVGEQKDPNEDAYDLCGDPLEQPKEDDTNTTNSECFNCNGVVNEFLKSFSCIVIFAFWVYQSIMFVFKHIAGNEFLFRSAFIFFIGIIVFALFTLLRLIMAMSDLGIWFASTMLLIYLLGCSFCGILWYEGFNLWVVIRLIHFSIKDNAEKMEQRTHSIWAKMLKFISQHLIFNYLCAVLILLWFRVLIFASNDVRFITSILYICLILIMWFVQYIQRIMNGSNREPIVSEQP